MDGGDSLAVEELRRSSACPASSENVLRTRIARAIDAFFATKAARPHRGLRARVVASIGCEDEGSLLVSLGLGLGVGQSLWATFEVEERHAVFVAGGRAIAHEDLDGDGLRDVIWLPPDRHVAVRFASNERSARTLQTGLDVPESEDTDSFFAGAPSLESAFALVLAYRTFNGSSLIERRLRWNGKEFVDVSRLTDDDFETRYETARERELAVLDDPISGGFGKLRSELDRCAQLTTVDIACKTAFDSAVAKLTTGGISESDAREALRSYLGWQRCPRAAQQLPPAERRL